MKNPNNKILPRADFCAQLVETNMTLQALYRSRALKQSDSATEFSRLMAAAVVNLKFRHLLLTDAAQAIALGYQGETFHFSPSERQLLLSIKARTLEEFALKLVTLVRLYDKSKIKQQLLE